MWSPAYEARETLSHGRRQRDKKENFKRADHAEKHARHADGRREPDAPYPGPHAGRTSLQPADRAGDRPPGERRPGVPARLHDHPRGQPHRLHRGVHRSRPVRRPERQPVPRAHPQPIVAPGRRPGVGPRADRQQGGAVLPLRGRQRRGHDGEHRRNTGDRRP